MLTAELGTRAALELLNWPLCGHFLLFDPMNWNWIHSSPLATGIDSPLHFHWWRTSTESTIVSSSIVSSTIVSSSIVSSTIVSSSIVSSSIVSSSIVSSTIVSSSIVSSSIVSSSIVSSTIVSSSIVSVGIKQGLWLVLRPYRTSLNNFRRSSKAKLTVACNSDSMPYSIS